MEKKFTRKTPSVFLQIIIPVLVIIISKIILILIANYYSSSHSTQIIQLALLSFFGLGKFIIFAPVVPLNNLDFDLLFSSYQLAALVVYMDTAVAFIIVYNFHLLKKIYWLGDKLSNVQKDCYYLLQSNTWMRDWAIIGIILFVCFPIAGTGAIGAAFLASLLGFSRLVSIFWIFVGSVIGCFGMALGSVYLKAKLHIFLKSPVFFFSSLIIGILILIWCGWKMRDMIRKQKMLENN